jgi:hypothetical protein
MTSADEGGDPPCWAHLMDELDVDDVPSGRRHPWLAAVLLMIGVVLLLLALSFASIVW